MKTTQRLLTVFLVVLTVMAGASVAGATTRSPVSIRVNLDATTATAGHPIRGTAILTNSSGKTILVEACASDGWLFVGLTNKNIPYDPAVAAVACNATVKLEPGANRFVIEVSTDYQVCTMTGSPRCGKLPDGTYHTAIETQGLPSGTHHSASIRVTLI